jgi:flagellar biogenesis protein FliO
VVFDGSIAGSLSMVLGLLLIPALLIKKLTKNSKQRIVNV